MKLAAVNCEPWKKWVVDGHSQGGLAVWGVAEQEAVLKQPDYLGAVAVAAATLHDGWLVAHPDTTKNAGFHMAWLAYGIHARFPALGAEVYEGKPRRRRAD